MAKKRPITKTTQVEAAQLKPPAGAALTPKEVLGILRRHILLILVMTVFGITAGAGIWKMLQIAYPKYVARTYIQVLSPVNTDPLTIEAAQVENTLMYNYRRSIANLIKQQSTLQELIGRNRVNQTDWFNNTQGNIRKAVRSLDKNFVAYPQRDSDFVEISMACSKADEAATIVNEMLELFLAKQSTTETAEITEKLIQLENQKTDIERDLRLAEESLDKIRQDSGITDLDTSDSRYFQHTITLKLNNLELEKDKLDLAIKQFQADMANLEQLATGPITEQIELIIQKDAVLISLTQQLAIQEAQYSSLLSRLGENHRSVQQAKELIEQIKQAKEARKEEIAEQTRQANLQNARDNLLILQKRFDELEILRQQAEEQKKQLDNARIEYDRVLKIRDERQTLLDSIKEQIEKWKIIAADPQTPKVQAVGLAPEPLEMVISRQWWLWLPSFTMLGFLLGIGLCFIAELSNDLVRTPNDVAKHLHLPLLGIIPDSSEDSQVRRIKPAHIVRKAPFSITSESYRRCRTNLKLSAQSGAVKSLLICSGLAGDGATTTAVNLATTMAAEDKKVLLIDANFRNPSLNKLFPKLHSDNSKTALLNLGLSSILVRHCNPDEAIRPSEIEGLDIIDCGPPPVNPAELLDSTQMKALMTELGKQYDYVIIDGPALLLVSDSKILASLTDASLLVFNATSTSIGTAQRTIRELLDVNAQIAGCVLFAVRSLKGGYMQEQISSYRKYSKKHAAANRI